MSGPRPVRTLVGRGLRLGISLVVRGLRLIPLVSPIIGRLRERFPGFWAKLRKRFGFEDPAPPQPVQPETLPAAWRAEEAALAECILFATGVVPVNTKSAP